MGKSKREPFVLPDEECQRMTQPEMTSLRWLMNIASELERSREDLKKRLEMVPHGMQRMNMLSGGMDSLFADVLGTVSRKQCRNLIHTANDYRVRLVPTVSGDVPSVAVRKDDFKTLVDAAREKCKHCAEDGKSARKCELYQLLEVYVPLSDYGNDLMCPYVFREWEDRK